MWSTGVNTKRIICIFLEVLMIAFVFTYSWTLDAPNRESKASFEAATAQQIVLRNTSGASELPYEFASKAYFIVNDNKDFLIESPAIEIGASEGLNVTPSLRNPFYAYTTINAP